ncbi:hypothetical protein GQ43DRAFT_412931 [Delitschia confertaspora ATCC 74209]|uniref:Transmembrane protein n=1 Tax=Delitschia confertaspora ATCC 74209 TaxID=1513339 RepID=A0A9P4MU86_9PLEO|nr:hypothetical protein GQ43DRAFT_412931 [Delitschia confertaspora ATCC 74209]
MMALPFLLQFGIFPLLALAQAASPTAQAPSSQELPNNLYNGGEDNPVDPNIAGAEGSSKGAFTLSRGAIAAIITVAVLIAVGGTVSAVLFWLAKKRQWDVRQSIRRASRRLTGRSTAANTKRQNRRTGVRLNSPPPSKRVGNRQRDLEKGAPASGPRGQTTTTISSTFDVDTPTPKAGWKGSMFSGKK